MIKGGLKKRIEKSGFLVLDGGLATELEAMGHNLADSLWSARLVSEEPEEIVKVHKTYIDAGAHIVTSASYQASEEGFRDAGFFEDEARQLLRRSVELANQAADNVGTDRERPLVAVGIGPYGAYLADGSEYTGNYPGFEYSELYRFHKKRWELLAETSFDFFLCETIPNFTEAEVLIDIAKETGVETVISFSARDGKSISDRTPIEECASMIAESEFVSGIGVNCTKPRFISELIGRIKTKANDKLIAVYPNSGEEFDGREKSWSGKESGHDLSDLAQTWLEEGANIIGGCCRTDPAEIAQIAQRLATNQTKK